MTAHGGTADRGGDGDRAPIHRIDIDSAEHIGHADQGFLPLANEFAEVRVRLVRTGNGVRLEITSPRTGHAVRLCPLELEALARQPPAFFSTLVAGDGTAADGRAT